MISIGSTNPKDDALGGVVKVMSSELLGAESGSSSGVVVASAIDAGLLSWEDARPAQPLSREILGAVGTRTASRAGEATCSDAVPLRAEAAAGEERSFAELGAGEGSAASLSRRACGEVRVIGLC